MSEKPRFDPPGFQRGKMQALMRERGLAGVLLTSPENVFYTTGYTCLPSAGNPILYTLRNRLPFFSYVGGDGKVTLICWGFSAEGVEFGVDNLIGFSNHAGALDTLRLFLSDETHGKSRIGIESTCPHYVSDIVREAGGTGLGLESADDLLATLRLIKTPEEIARIQKSTLIIESVVSELYDIMYGGMSRLELMQEAKARMIRHGANGISHVTFSFAGQNPEIAIDEPLAPGRLATLDLGAVYEGYCSDNRRYAYAGEVPDSLLERYHVMVDMVDRVGDALHPGTIYADLFRLAVDLYADNGIQPLGRFNHVGHNIGLETEEEWLDDRADRQVEEGMVITIELYSTAETGEQIGNEETYVIERGGPRRISVLPREIRSVRAAAGGGPTG